MCGIFAYSGKKQCCPIIFDGLKKLKYRGYDSWGIAIFNNNDIKLYKNIGGIKKSDELNKLGKSSVGIGHSRWATHGGVTVANAHPHKSDINNFCIVHNGIVENFEEFKNRLLSCGVSFKSQTDTEIIVKLIDEQIAKKKGIKEAIISVFKELEGRNTITVLTNDRKIYAVKNGSPLVIGIAKDGIYLSSDTLSFSNATNEVLLLDDYDFVEIDGMDLHVQNILTGKSKLIKTKTLKVQFSDISKGKYPHYMLKEIMDQKEVLIHASNYSEKDLSNIIQAAKKAKHVFTLGAGTAGFASGQVAYFLRKIASMDAREIKSYEFKSFLPIIEKNDLIIAFSQSGETADTIEAVEIMKEKGCLIASVVNMLGTTLSRISDYEFYTNSGPEICVASTKVFTAQCIWGYLLAMSIANKHKKAKSCIKKLSLAIQITLTKSYLKNIENIAKELKDIEHAFILGKGENSFIALEGALKIKEISYKHIEEFPAGELKHGIIALISKNTPVFGIIPPKDNEDNKDLISAIEQVKARGAFTIGIGSKDCSKMNVFDRYIETPNIEGLTSIGNVIPFQLISYYLSLALGNNIDKPRNLAKSVTVK